MDKIVHTYIHKHIGRLLQITFHTLAFKVDLIYYLEICVNKYICIMIHWVGLKGVCVLIQDGRCTAGHNILTICVAMFLYVYHSHM
jgi:hypothetical protein